MAERRAHPRLKLPLDATCECDGARAAVRVVDIGLSGCYVVDIGLSGPDPGSGPLESWVTPALGQFVTLTIHFPTGASVRLDAWVVSTQPSGGFGVWFANVEEQVRSMLAEQLMALGLANPWGTDRQEP